MFAIQIASMELFQIGSSLGAEAVGEFSCTATSDLGSVVATTRVTGGLLSHQNHSVHSVRDRDRIQKC